MYSFIYLSQSCTEALLCTLLASGSGKIADPMSSTHFQSVCKNKKTATGVGGVMRMHIQGSRAVAPYLPTSTVFPLNLTSLTPTSESLTFLRFLSPKTSSPRSLEGCLSLFLAQLSVTCSAASFLAPLYNAFFC